MSIKQFNLPDPGEGLLEAEIVEWKVAVGDTVAVNDIVVEVETAKSLVELPIPWAGVVTELLAAVGDEVAVGTAIISIDDGLGDGAGVHNDAGAGRAAAAAAGAPEEEPVKTLVGYGPKAGAASRRRRRKPSYVASADSAVLATTSADVAREVARGGRVLAKPPVRKFAKDLGIDLGAVPASGDGGVVTRSDIESYAASGGSASGTSDSTNLASARAGGAAAAYAPEPSEPGETREPIKGVRKLTAQAMVDSAFTAPHVTEWVTVDVTATVDLVAKLKQDKEFAEVKVSPLLILAKAMLLAVRRHPEINSAWDQANQEIVRKGYVNLGIAAATPRGLVVPNIKNAGRLSLRALADAIAELTDTARAGRTQPADMGGGTITITNIGVFGIDGGTPILNPGEAAILAFGAINRRPWVVLDEDGQERIVARSVTTLALSFDHRLIDGELGPKFLADVAAILEDPTKALLWG